MASGLVLVLLAALVQAGSGHRILGLFGHPGLSHYKVFYPIVRGLAEAGHEVTVVSYFPGLGEPHTNLTEYEFKGQKVVTNAFSMEDFSGRTFMDNFKEFYSLAMWGHETCKAALSSPALDQVLAEHRRKPFDLLLTEFFSTDCLLGLSHVLRLPLVGMSSCALMPWHYDRVGLPDSPGYIPSEFSTFSERMSFLERFENWFVTRTTKLLYRVVEWNDNRLLAGRFGEGVPDVRDIARNTSLLLVNQHYTLSGARPLVPAVVEVGGVHIGPSKPLADDLQRILDDAKEGVLVISFGSILRASTLPAAKREALLSALKRIPLKVIWKWEDENAKDMPKNVIVRKWLPQRDVLCHPNVRLFLSHGGLLGVSEAVHCAVPVVVMPIYGDQFLNAMALVNRGMGVIMHYDKIDPDYVHGCIQEGLRKEVRDSAVAVSAAFRHRTLSPLEQAVWSIENVLTHGSRRLEKSYGSEVSMAVYYSWDVIFVFGAMILAVLVSMRKGFKIVFGKKCDVRGQGSKVKRS